MARPGRPRKNPQPVEPEEVLDDQSSEDSEEPVEQTEAASASEPTESGRAEKPVEEEQYVSRQQYDDALRAQEELQGQLEDTQRRYDEREQQTQYVLGRQGQEIGDLKKMVAAFSQPTVPTMPKRRIKLDPIGDENFGETLETFLGETLTERENRLRREFEEKHRQDLDNLRWEMSVQREAEQLRRDYGFNDRDIKEAAEYGTQQGIPNLQAAAFMVPRLRDRIFKSSRNGPRDNRRDNRRDDNRRYNDPRHDDYRQGQSNESSVKTQNVQPRKVAEEFMKPKPAPPVRGGARPNDGDIQTKVMNMTVDELDAMTDAERTELFRKVQAASLAGTRTGY